MIGVKRFARIGRVVPGTSLIPIPFAIASAALILLAATLAVDALARAGRVALPAWLSVGSVDDARAILGAILGAVSTVLALIFSVTLLVFSMAVSQFGPRLMPYFLRDRAMQTALGLFLASFLHSLLTFVVTGQRGQAIFNPQLTVLASVALVFVSFCYLVIYNHRIALAMQTNNMLARIVEDLNEAIGQLTQPRVIGNGAAISPRLESDTPSRSPPEVSADVIRRRCIAEGGLLKAATSGYVQRIDRGRIVKMADGLGAVASLAFRPGEFVVEGETLAYVLPAARSSELEAAIQDAVKIGQHRTLEQDAEFAFAQLSEIALRALSPAINDTYTGLSSIDYLGDALRMFAALPASNGLWRANQGEIRLVIPPLHFERVVRASFDLIRQAAANSPEVCLRLLQTCTRLASQLRDNDQRCAILYQVEAVHETAERMPNVHIDREALSQAYREACARLKAV